ECPTFIGGFCNGLFDVFSDHVYTSTGTFDITVSISSLNTAASTIVHSTARVANQLAASGITLQATQGVDLKGSIATFVDQNTSDTGGNLRSTAMGSTSPPGPRATGSTRTNNQACSTSPSRSPRRAVPVSSRSRLRSWTAASPLPVRCL